MWVITYFGKPSTIQELYIADDRVMQSQIENPNRYLTGKLKSDAMEEYIYYFGYDWDSRTEFVEAQLVDSLRHARRGVPNMKRQEYLEAEREIKRLKAWEENKNAKP